MRSTDGGARANAAPGSNPAVFIMGCPRSGTTLLKRMFDAHRDVAIQSEARWVPEYSTRSDLVDPDGAITPALVQRLLATPFDRKIPRPVSPDELERLLELDPRPTYGAVLSLLYDRFARAYGKTFAGNKTPTHVFHVRALHHLWPGAKFVHIVRDGRDVCLSATTWERKLPEYTRWYETWNEDPVTTAALWWEWHVRAGRDAAASLPSGTCCEVRYETLVTQPDSVCEELCAFLDLPYDRAMSRYHEGRAKPEARDAKHAWLPPTPGLRDWRTQMTAADLERVEAAAGDLLTELGYPRAVTEPRGEAGRHAADLRQRFVAGLARAIRRDDEDSPRAP